MKKSRRERKKENVNDIIEHFEYLEFLGNFHIPSTLFEISKKLFAVLNGSFNIQNKVIGFQCQDI